MTAVAQRPALLDPPHDVAGWVGRRFPLAAHITVNTASREPRFEDAALALEVFLLLREHPRTLAAVVMPGTVHWLLRGGWDLAEVVDRLKQESTQRAVAEGDDRPLWQHCFFDTPVETEAVVRMSARFLLANPVVAGLAGRWQDYPWAWLSPTLGG